MPNVQSTPDSFVFRSEDHKERFVAAMKQLGKIYSGQLDEEYSAALYLLTASTWKKACSYVRRTGIDFEAMLEETDFSGGETVMIELASNLFNGNTHVDPLELMRLDSTNFEIAIQALRFRRDPVHLEDLEEDLEASDPTKKPTV
jgi:hypothetical protein